MNQIDGAFTVPDENSIATLYQLLDNEGIYLGASSALNVAAAVELAQRLKKGISLGACSSTNTDQECKGSKIVTILCDGAYRYQSRLFSKKWLESKGLSSAIPEHLQKYAVLD